MWNRISSRWFWVAGGVIALIAAVYGAAFLVDEPLRRSIEREMNGRLKGYTVHLGGASFHPHGFSLDLKNVVVTQDANPDPPVMRIARLRGSVQWRALLHGRLVGDMLIERPSVYLNLAHVKREMQDPTPIRQRGWQDALQAAYPLTINEFELTDGDLMYIDSGPFKPLRISRLNVSIEDIRNIKSAPRVYPSPLRLEGDVFDTGRVVVDGHADFLATPYPGVSARFALERMQVDYFEPVTRRYNVSVTKGVLSSAGQFEYSPAFKAATLDHVTLQDAHVIYTHRADTAATEKEVAGNTAKATKEVADRPDIDLKVDRVDIRDSTVGLVNDAATPPYRLFLSQANLNLHGLSNQSARGPAQAVLKGKFMGTGDTDAHIAFRPDRRGGDLDLKVAIEGTDMVGMNDLLRSWGKFDVSAGRFSFYSELNVKNGALTGYVKPLFKDVVAYDPQKDRQKSFGEKVYRKLVQQGAKLLKNRPQREVATKADLSGRLDNPQTDTLQIIGQLVKNAFFKAIGHGFESEGSAGSG